MLKQSFAYNFCIKLFSCFINGIKSSAVFALAAAAFAAFDRTVKGSAVYGGLMKEIFTEKYYKSSVFYRILGFFRDLLLNTAKAVLSWLRRVFGSSYLYGTIDFLTEKGLLSLDVFLALYVGVMLIAPHEMWNNLYAVIAAVIFAAWSIIVMVGKRAAAASGEAHRVPISVIVFVAAILCGVIIAPKLGDALKAALFMISALIFMGSAILSLNTRKKLLRFISIILFFVTLTAVYGLYQRSVGVEVNEEFVDIYQNQGMPGRVYSTFFNPNNFAEILIMFMPFFIPLFFLTKKYSGKALCAIGFALSFAALLMTYSRSSWLGFAIAIVIFVVLYDIRLLIPLGILAFAAVPFLPETILNRILTIGSLADSSNSYRVYIWESCLSMVGDYFVTGVGIGSASFTNVYYEYATSAAIIAMHAHMLYLELILETGIMGFLGFMGYVYSIIKNGVREIARKTPMRIMIIAAISALFGIFFVGCAEYIWFYPRVMFAFFIIPAVLVSAVRVSRCEDLR